MHFSPEVTLGFLLMLAAYLVGVTSFIVRTNTKANTAHDMAKEAQSAVSVQTAALSLYKEHVASQYVDRQDLSEMEKRLTAAINNLGNRLDRRGSD